MLKLIELLKINDLKYTDEIKPKHQKKIDMQTEIFKGEVSVHYQNDTPIQKGSFTLKSDAMLYIKDMIKKHKLKRGKGFWYNMKNAVEMTTNF